MSDALRVVVVDDSRLARNELRTLMTGLSWIDCVGEADDVPAAQRVIRELMPDVVLLDIQMPSGTGFDVLDSLEAMPQVIFVTAYDHHAVAAFEANALDYLVKPVVAERLQAALEKARERDRRQVPLASADAPSRLQYDDQVFLRDGENCWFVALGEIRRIVVDGNYVRLWFRDQTAMLARSLSALEARIQPGLFFRANRNTLVNLKAVRAVELGVGDGYELTLDDGSRVEVSRRQARELRERLAL